MWLFGGLGYDSTGSQGNLNDLWTYSGGAWTWAGGSNVINQSGAYVTSGTPDPHNAPGARYAAVGWSDVLGNIWLFGGYGFDSAGKQDALNDLWEYVGGEWTWVSGSSLVDQSGAYGTLGIRAPTNVPGARYGSASWIDAAGNFWVFGGFDDAGVLNDLWRYGGGQWTWESGSTMVNQSGVYGTLGVGVPGNTPGARATASAWSDAAGNLWLFGGVGVDGPFNDLWKFEP